MTEAEKARARELKLLGKIEKAEQLAHNGLLRQLQNARNPCGRAAVQGRAQEYRNRIIAESAYAELRKLIEGAK